MIVNSATSALSLISLFSCPINFYKYSTSLLWLATAANASCLTISASASFSMHYLTKDSYYPQPIWPKIKQTSCFNNGDWVEEYCFDNKRHKTWIASEVPKSLMWYIILYFSNKVISVSYFNKRPRNPYLLKNYLNFFYSKNCSNSSFVKGAAGSLVAKNLVPYKLASYLRLAFSKEILQVSES